MANEAIPLFDPADAITAYVELAVTGKRFVALSGPTVDGLAQVSPCGAGATALGVAMRSAATSGKVGVYRVGIIPVLCSGALAYGDPVASDAAGKAIKATPGDAVLGWSFDDYADNVDAFIILNPQAIGGNAVAGAAVADMVFVALGAAGINGTIDAIADPADAPGTADALRDDLVANALPAIRNALGELATKQNVILARLRDASTIAP